jgi:hypothetical protein
MKKYIFLAACALGLSLTSCEDFLDYNEKQQHTNDTKVHPFHQAS